MADEKSLQEFTNSELKDILKKINLPTAGNKAELLARILAADSGGQSLRGNDIDLGEAACEEKTSDLLLSDMQQD